MCNAKYLCQTVQKVCFIYFTEMKRIQVHKSYLWNIYVFPLVFITTVACYPIQKIDLQSQPELGDEKRFPNGSTIGKYTYMDNEGNPIQVKYYADDASYGVEMKSIKMVDTTGEPFTTMDVVQNAPNRFDTETDAKTAADLLNTNNFPVLQDSYRVKTHEFTSPYEMLNKDVSKTNRYKVEKPNPDYEIFYQNDLKGAKKCSKEKVRVYFDNKENRKMRSVVNDLAEADKFCEPFTN